jgi:hypothetical protein
VRRVELLGVAVALVADRRRLPARRVVRRRRGEQLAVGVVGAAAVAHRDVQHPVGPEGQVAAVVVELRPVHAHELAPAGGIGHAPRRRPLGQDVLMVWRHARRHRAREGRQPDDGLRGVGVQLSVRPVVGVERHPQEAALVEGSRPADAQRHQPPADVQDQCLGPGRQVDTPELARLVDHVQAGGVARGRDRLHRRYQVLGHDLQVDPGAARPADPGEDRVVVGIVGRVRLRSRCRQHHGHQNEHADSTKPHLPPPSLPGPTSSTHRWLAAEAARRPARPLPSVVPGPPVHQASRAELSRREHRISI